MSADEHDGTSPAKPERGRDQDEAAKDAAAALRETLTSLELPPDAVGPWLAHVRAFCDAHGGRRVYGELLRLLDRCDEAK